MDWAFVSACFSLFIHYLLRGIPSEESTLYQDKNIPLKEKGLTKYDKPCQKMPFMLATAQREIFLCTGIVLTTAIVVMAFKTTPKVQQPQFTSAYNLPATNQILVEGEDQKYIGWLVPPGMFVTCSGYEMEVGIAKVIETEVQCKQG
jgi:hypothetical protein